MNSRPYPASVFWSDDDEGFIAIAPDLPGCSAFGLSREEALQELEPAIAAWIDAASAAGNPIPLPSDPASEPAASGKYLLRMPRALHATLIRQAKRENTSLNQHMVFLLTRASCEQEQQQTPVTVGTYSGGAVLGSYATYSTVSLVNAAIADFSEAAALIEFEPHVEASSANESGFLRTLHALGWEGSSRA